MNKKYFLLFRRIDYAGISIFMTGTAFPPYSYNFYCEPVYYFIYLGIISFVAIIVFITS